MMRPLASGENSAAELADVFRRCITRVESGTSAAISLALT